MLPTDDTLIADALRRPPEGGEVKGYRIEAVLGRGAQTTVYQAGRSGTRYALKSIPFDGLCRPVAEAALRDAELLKKLRHEHLSSVVEVFSFGPAAWIVSSLAKGRSADNFADGILGWEVAVQAALRTAKALTYAWRFHQLPHRNLKPSNLILDIQGGILVGLTVTDHGLVREGMSASEVVLGGPLYQAPEVRAGAAPDAAADLYSLGAVLHFLLVGQPPAAPEDGGAARLAAVPPPVADLVARLLAPDVHERPESWEETVAALDACLGDNPFEAPTTGRVEQRRGGTTPLSSGISRAGSTPTASLRADPVGSWLFDRVRETARIARNGGDQAGLAAGTMVAGVYTVTAVLRTGVLIEHYAVEEAILGRSLVLKILTTAGMANPVLVNRLAAEGILLGSIHNPSFPFVAGRGRWEGREYLAVERVSGADLKTYLQRKGRFAEGQALWVANEVATALDHGYDTCRLVHRDLKPANLAVADGAEPRLKIVDFSTALYLAPRDLQDFSSSERELIADPGAGRAVGTPAYMSPEQARGEAAGPHMDMYALGCLLYHLIAGETPFRAANAVMMMQAHIDQPAPDLAQAVEVTPSTAALVARCLAKHPRDRFPAWKQLRQAIQSASFATQAAKRRRDRGQTGTYTREVTRTPAPGT